MIFWSTIVTNYNLKLLLFGKKKKYLPNVDGLVDIRLEGPYLKLLKCKFTDSADKPKITLATKLIK